MRQLTTPVLLIIFNRIETTKQVFNAIRQVRPNHLYIAGDGARENEPRDNFKVEEVRNYVLKNIDWTCKVETLFSDINLGCQHGPYSAFNWFFSTEEKGIILEDDCLPSPSFFFFCEDALNHFAENKSISIISGRNNLGSYKNDTGLSHIFSSKGITWGWATWSDRMESFNVDKGYYKPFQISKYVYSTRLFLVEYLMLRRNHKALTNRQVVAWDWPLDFHFREKKMLSVVPVFNYVKNIGFGPDATHTKNKTSENIGWFDNYESLKESKIVCDYKYVKRIILKQSNGYIGLVMRAYLGHIKPIKKFYRFLNRVF